MSAHANLERRRQAIYGWLLLTPALVLLSVFAFYPTVATLWDKPVFTGYAAQSGRIYRHWKLYRTFRGSDVLDRR